MSAEMATKTTSSARIQTICFFSFISLTMLPLIKSSVSTELEVSTSEDSVLIEADSTSTMTRPMRTSGRFESMVGMIES